MAILLLSNVYAAHYSSPTSEKNTTPPATIESTNQNNPPTSQISMPGRTTQSGTASQTRRPSLQPLSPLSANRATDSRPQGYPKGITIASGSAPSESYQSSVGLATGDGFCPPAKPGGFDGKCNNLTYHGGAIMHNVQFVLLLWAGCGSEGCINCQTGYFDTNDCTYANLILQYFEDFCKDQPILDLVNQYTDGLGPMGSCSVFGGTTFVSWAPFPSNPLADSDIRDIASTAIVHLGVQPAPFPLVDTEVLVFTPIGVGSCEPSGNCFPGGTVCAWHGSTIVQSSVPPVVVAYANIPDVGSFDCGISTFNSNSPTSDPLADAAINMASHESIESITDPLSDAWYFNDLKHEISDECNFDLSMVEPDNSNVHLGPNGDPFLIQTEWSNFNGGCTFDLVGAPVKTVINLTPDKSTGTTATWPPGGFPIGFLEAGEWITNLYNGMPVYSSLTQLFLGSGSGTMTVFVTPIAIFPNLYINDPYFPATNPGEQWCFDSVQCRYLTTDITSPTILTYTFYDLLAQRPYVCFNRSLTFCAPPPSSFGTDDFTVNLQYVTAPNTPGMADTPQTVSETLGTDPNSPRILAVRGSAASWPNCIPFNNFLGSSCGNAGERYSNGGVCNSLLDCSTSRVVTRTDFITNLDYWDQYFVPVKYFTSDGSMIPSTPPSFTGTAFGLATPPLVLSTTPQSIWLDSASAWSVSPQTLAGSTSTVRWFAPGVSGFESGTNPINVVYVHQYYVIFEVGLGSGSTSPMSSWQTAGSTITITALPAPGYKFAAWTSSTSMIRLAFYASSTTKATLNGPGTITVLFHRSP